MKEIKISDAELLDYLAGRLGKSRSLQIRQRISTDLQLKCRADELKNTWEMLGNWEVNLPKIDVTANVLSKINSDKIEESPAVIKLTSRWTTRQFARLAAMWICAISLGVIAAAWLGTRQNPHNKTQQNSLVKDLSEDELEQNVQQYLSLDTLTKDSGLVSAIDQQTTNSEEVEG